MEVHCWLVPPLQSQSSTWVPLVWLAPGTSRQRPEADPTSVPLVPPVPPLPGVIDRLSNCAVSPWLVPYPTWPAAHVESLAVPTWVPSMVAVMVLPENCRDRLCQRPVPRAATLPLARVVEVLLVLLRWIDQAPLSLTRR